MEPKNSYDLYGYISYLKSEVDFITPVFKDIKGKSIIQVSTSKLQAVEWVELPLEYEGVINTVDYPLHADKHDSFIYGFKWEKGLFFSSGINMSEYLAQTFLPASKEGIDLAKAFIDDWKTLEPFSKELTGEDIWKASLEIIASESRTMPKIFSENVEIVSFSENQLLLKSENADVKKVFEKQYKDQIEEYFKANISDFKIDFIHEERNILPHFPIIHFGGDTIFHAQGSFLRHSQVTAVQKNDNFILGDFNATAYSKAINIFSSSGATLLIIEGIAGIGKTHLLNAVTQKLRISSPSTKIGFYSVLYQQDYKIEIDDGEFAQIEMENNQNDLIIIDDAHNIKNTATLRLSNLLKKWSLLNKKVILSFRENQNKLRTYNELLQKADYAFLSAPTEFEKLQILKNKSLNYNINLTQYAISILCDNRDVNNIADLQRQMTLLYINGGLNSRNLVNTNKIQIDSNALIKWIEPTVSKYYNIEKGSLNRNLSEYYNVGRYAQKPSSRDSIFFSIKFISQFLLDLFNFSHQQSGNIKYGTVASGPVPFYSFEIVQRIFFEDENFREAIKEMYNDVVSRNLDKE